MIDMTARFFGADYRLHNYGAAIPLECYRCDNVAFHHMVKRRRWLYVAWISVLPLGRQQKLLMCEVCNEPRLLNSQQWKALHPSLMATRRFQHDSYSDREYLSRLAEIERDVPGLDMYDDWVTEIEDMPDSDESVGFE